VDIALSQTKTPGPLTPAAQGLSVWLGKPAAWLAITQKIRSKKSPPPLMDTGILYRTYDEIGTY
jgi:hypothetical protein